MGFSKTEAGKDDLQLTSRELAALDVIIEEKGGRTERAMSVPTASNRKNIPKWSHMLSSPTLREEKKRLESKRDLKLLERFWSAKGPTVAVAPYMGADTPITRQVLPRLGVPKYEKIITALRLKLEKADAEAAKARGLSPTARGHRRGVFRPSTNGRLVAEFVFLVEMSLQRDMWEGLRTATILTNCGVHSPEDVRILCLAIGVRIMRDSATVARMRAVHSRDGGFCLRDVFAAVKILIHAVTPVSCVNKTSMMLSIQVLKTLVLIPQLIDLFHDARGLRQKRAVKRIQTQGTLDSLFQVKMKDKRRKPLVVVLQNKRGLAEIQQKYDSENRSRRMLKERAYKSGSKSKSSKGYQALGAHDMSKATLEPANQDEKKQNSKLAVPDTCLMTRIVLSPPSTEKRKKVRLQVP